jgi:2-dehydro-3-deoxyphosphogluconate aldolase/(4S)-4-hydroxy-2-oxoglutarate aldolase
MSRHTRLQVYNAMKELGLVPLFYHPEAETAIQIVAACLKGGCPLVEFTNRGDRAIQVFEELAAYRDRERPELILGVGSVCNAPTAVMYIQAGADFIVAPLLDEETAKVCNGRKIPYLPGCGSVTEIHQAHVLGVEVCKIFPAGQVGGPAFIKSVKAPCSWAELMPSGGVSPTKENLTEWFDAGAACVGMGSKLISKELIAAGDYESLSKQINSVLTMIREIRDM